MDRDGGGWGGEEMGNGDRGWGLEFDVVSGLVEFDHGFLDSVEVFDSGRGDVDGVEEDALQRWGHPRWGGLPAPVGAVGFDAGEGLLGLPHIYHYPFPEQCVHC